MTNLLKVLYFLVVDGPNALVIMVRVAESDPVRAMEIHAVTGHQKDTSCTRGSLVFYDFVVTVFSELIVRLQAELLVIVELLGDSEFIVAQIKVIRDGNNVDKIFLVDVHRLVQEKFVELLLLVVNVSPNNLDFVCP